MDMVVFITVGIILFLIARNFMEFEQNSTPLNEQSSSQENSTNFFNKKEEIQDETDYESLQIETGIVVALMAKLSTADGKVCELEREFIDNSLKDFSEPFPDPVDTYNILNIIFDKESEKGSSNIEKLTHQYYELTRYAYTKRVKVLQHIINLAYIDKTFSQSEEKIFKEISDGFQIHEPDYHQLIESFKKFYADNMPEVNDPDKASEILEISKDSSLADIKKRYRELARKFHPDVLKSQGFNDEVIEENTRKLQEMNEAYEALKKYKK